jgi:hypothetical protein
MIFAVLIIAAYLLGSIPFGLIIAAAHGKNLRSIGSGNIGATNLARAVGRKWAYLCFALDAAKGAVVMLAPNCFAASSVACGRMCGDIRAYLPHIREIQGRQRGGNKFRRCSRPLAILYPLRTLDPYYLGCRCLAVAICFPRLDYCFGCLPDNTRSGCGLNTRLEFHRSMAVAGNRNCSAYSGNPAPSGEYKKINCRHGKKNFSAADIASHKDTFMEMCRIQRNCFYSEPRRASKAFTLQLTIFRSAFR